MKRALEKYLYKFCLLALAGSFLFYGQSGSAQNSGWSKVAFEGSNVSFVGVNPYQQAEVMAVVDGNAQLTLDGGLLWRALSIPEAVTALAFDPVEPDKMYVGTNRGIYYSGDRGASWQSFGSIRSQALNVSSLTITNDAIFTTQFAGTGSGQEELFKIDRSGRTTSLDLITPYIRQVSSDSSNNVLYVSTIGPLYRSKDDGATWETVADAPNIGGFTSQINAQNGQIWQTSPGGVYESLDSGLSWDKKAGYPVVDEFYPGTGSHPAGLAVNGPNGFFGLKEKFYNVHEVYEVGLDAPNKLNFPDFPNSIAAGNEQLWVAGETGLWRRGGLVKNQSQIKRPLVVVPGTMGSWSVLGKWELDPITRTYNNLMKTLVEEGYVKGVTLFDFPYNWRADDNDSARLLGQKIANIRKTCQCFSVDVIGHSQGGLVARAYIESGFYSFDVANLVELGTPNAGSVEAYSLWEAGVSVDQNILIRYGLKIFSIEAVENGFVSIAGYIRTKVPSLEQLLPNYSYIDGRSYPSGYPQNAFLDVLNAPANLKLLKERTNLYIVGSDQKKTLTGLEVSTAKEQNTWPHGKILNKYYGSGDGTVPFDSLVSIAAPNFLENEDHGGLAKNPSQIWLQHLLGDVVPKPGDSLDQINRLMLVYVESPVRIAITDPNGLQVNDGMNQIDGAFYTGSDEQVQFATIPMPIEGDYKIKLTGKASGKYTVGFTIFDDEKGDTGSEQMGQTMLGQTDYYQFNTSDTSLSTTSGSTSTSSLASFAKSSANGVAKESSIEGTTVSDMQNFSNNLAELQAANALHGQIKKPNGIFGRFKNMYLVVVLFLLMLFGTITASWLRKK